MAKEVTVLSLEGKFLRGVRLAESGGSFSRPVVETWSLAADAQAGDHPDDGAGSQADGGQQLSATASETAATNGGDGDPAGDAMSAADLLATRQADCRHRADSMKRYGLALTQASESN